MKTLTDITGLAGAESGASPAAYMPEARGEYAIQSWTTSTGAERVIRDTSVSKTVRIVGLLAFGHSLLFLALWLLICSSAGATPAKKVEFSPDLSLSTYEPTKQRSPLSKSGVGVSEGKTESGAPVNLQLEGVLYQASNPAAVVNGQVLMLNKPVTLTSGGGEIQVRAVEITRNRVVVEVGGRKMELRLSPQFPPERP